MAFDPLRQIIRWEHWLKINFLLTFQLHKHPSVCFQRNTFKCVLCPSLYSFKQVIFFSSSSENLQRLILHHEYSSQRLMNLNGFWLYLDSEPVLAHFHCTYKRCSKETLLLHYSSREDLHIQVNLITTLQKSEARCI